MEFLKNNKFIIIFTIVLSAIGYIFLYIKEEKNENILIEVEEPVIEEKEIIEEIIKMGVDIRDMEGCAIAQVCTSNNAKLIMLKGITDVYGLGTDGEQFVLNLKKVSQGFPNQLKTIFENI